MPDTLHTGVYCVYLDSSIVGTDEPVVWTFANEGDAAAVQNVLIEHEGEGMAWYTYEPTAHSLSDHDLLEYMSDRLGIAWWRVLEMLSNA